MSDTELVELLRAAGSKSHAQPDRLPVRVLLRLALTVLLAIPVCLALALFLALEARPSRRRRPAAQYRVRMKHSINGRAIVPVTRGS
jgi:hypothetical protein